MRTGNRFLVVFSLLACLSPWSRAQTPLALMPLPSSTMVTNGSVPVDPGFSVQFDGYTEPRLIRARARFFATLSRRTGITVWDSTHPSTVLHVLIKAAGRPVQEVGEDESYQLVIGAQSASLIAATPLGALHGLQTVLQLVGSGRSGFFLPAITISDTPRFPWRGLMLDTSRHFMPVDVIKRNLDGMEALKLNVFHWHLSDDQGFRAQIATLPLLTEHGSDGLFYTRDEMEAIVAYARDRGIRVVPEIDMPGHVSALLAAYPALGSSPGPYAIERKWGIFNPALDPSRDSTYEFIDHLIAELSSIFPDAYFHIGGDECNGKEWDNNPAIQSFMKPHKLANDAALQAYFSSRVQQLVAAHGKIAIGWDEILQPDTAANVVIQSWHGPKAVAAAAGTDHKVILSKGYYLDLNLSAATHYAVDPLDGEAQRLTPAQQRNILGGEAAMWTEYVSSENVDSRIWPRAAAIAEKLWSPAASTANPDDLYRRLEVISQLLEAYGLQHKASASAMLQRIAGSEDAAPLRVLADVEEPPKQHERAHQGNYTVFTPLNRLVDAIPPESDQARAFALLCTHIANGTASPAEHQRARAQLTLWRQNDAKLRTLTDTELANDLGSASDALTDVANKGLIALDRIESGQRSTVQWLQEAHESLALDAKYHAAMSLAVVQPIAQLVDRSGSPTPASSHGNDTEPR